MHEIEYGPTPNDETISNEWFDQNSMTHYRMEALNASLQPLLDLGVFEESGMHLTEVVEYSTRSWSIGPATRTELGESTDADGLVNIPLSLSPTKIVAELHRGQLRLKGREVIDGVMTQQLSGVSKNGQRVDLWVDTTTYLVVRFQLIQRDYRFVTDVQWLPRNPTTLANLVITVPSGFTRVPVPQPPPSKR